WYSFALTQAVSLEWIREFRIRDELVIAQRLQEGDEGGFLGVIEIPTATKPVVEVGMPFDVLAVVIDDRLEGGESAIVHVGSGELDVPQGGRLEQSELGAVEREITHPTIGVLRVCVQPVIERP